MAQETESARGKDYIKPLYNTTRQLGGKPSNNTSVKDKTGVTFITIRRLSQKMERTL